VVSALRLGDDELATDELERLALEHPELDEPIVLGTLPATDRERSLGHEARVAVRILAVNDDRWIRHIVGR
jgi:hypothetical protein